MEHLGSGSRLITETLEDGRELLLVEYTYGDITIPSGFISDGASAPRILWPIIPRMYRTKRAAFIHDFLCKEAKTMEDRLSADKIFRRVLRDVSQINPVRYWLGYWGVRVGAVLGIGVYFPHWTDWWKEIIVR